MPQGEFEKLKLKIFQTALSKDYASIDEEDASRQDSSENETDLGN
jgi:hypothetical protein